MLFVFTGMRLIPESQANDVMKNIENLLNDKTLNPFTYNEHTTRMLSGEEEGAFAWIATNYLRGFFDNPGNTDEPPHVVLDSRENRGQNNQGARSRIEKSLGSREQRK